MRLCVSLTIIMVLGCGQIAPEHDAGEQGCVPGHTFCPLDAGYSVCGNIARWRDDCTIEYGCCLDGTPTCRDGQCIDWNQK